MPPAMRQITNREVCEMLDWFESEFGEAAPDDELQHRDNNRIAYAIETCYNGGLAQWFKDKTPPPPADSNQGCGYWEWVNQFTDHNDYLQSQAQDQL